MIVAGMHPLTLYTSTPSKFLHPLPVYTLYTSTPSKLLHPLNFYTLSTATPSHPLQPRTDPCPPAEETPPFPMKNLVGCFSRGVCRERTNKAAPPSRRIATFQHLPSAERLAFFCRTPSASTAPCPPGTVPLTFLLTLGLLHSEVMSPACHRASCFR